MLKKCFYETPRIWVLGVHTEGVVCQSGPYNIYGLPDITEEDVKDEYDSWN